MIDLLEEKKRRYKTMKEKIKQTLKDMLCGAICGLFMVALFTLIYILS